MDPVGPDWQNVDISVRIGGASKTVQNFANGQLTGAATYLASRRQISFPISMAFKVWLSTTTLQSVSANDATLHRQTIAGSQFIKTKGVLSRFLGEQTRCRWHEQLQMQLASTLSSSIIYSHSRSLTARPTFHAKLDALEALAVSGTLTKICLTDPGTPTLNITPAQVTKRRRCLRGPFRNLRDQCGDACNNLHHGRDGQSFRKRRRRSPRDGHWNLSAALAIIGAPTLQLRMTTRRQSIQLGLGRMRFTFAYMGATR